MDAYKLAWRECEVRETANCSEYLDAMYVPALGVVACENCAHHVIVGV